MAGHIISVIGGKGGVGKSIFSANLAFANAIENRAPTLLLDFDQTACGDLNIITGIQTKKTVKDIADFNGAIDPRSILQFTGVHPAKVSFIGMPRDAIAASQVNVEGLGKVLKSAVNIYPLTIIDLGSELNELTLKALDFSTLILLVTTPDLLAVNQSRRMFSNLMTQLFPKEMVHIVVNKSQKNHPVTHTIIGQQIGKQIFGEIVDDEDTCTLALSKTQPALVLNKNAPISKSFLEFVRLLNQRNVLKTLAGLVKPEDAGKKKSGSGAEEVYEPGKNNPWLQLKSRIHRGLVEEMDFKNQADERDPKAKLILREQTKK